MDESFRLALTNANTILFLNHIKIEGPKLLLSILNSFICSIYSKVVIILPTNRLFPDKLLESISGLSSKKVELFHMDSIDQIHSLVVSNISEWNQSDNLLICLPYTTHLIYTSDSSLIQLLQWIKKFNNFSKNSTSILYYLDSIHKFEDDGNETTGPPTSNIVIQNLNDPYKNIHNQANPNGLSYNYVMEYLISISGSIFHLYEKIDESEIDLKNSEKLRFLSINSRKRNGTLRTDKYNFTVQRNSGYMKLVSIEKFKANKDDDKNILHKNTEKQLFDQKTDRKTNEFLPFLYSEDKKLNAIHNPKKDERGLIYYVADKEDDFDEEDPDNDLNI